MIDAIVFFSFDRVSRKKEKSGDDFDADLPNDLSIDIDK